MWWSNRGICIFALRQLFDTDTNSLISAVGNVLIVLQLVYTSDMKRANWWSNCGHVIHDWTTFGFLENIDLPPR